MSATLSVSVVLTTHEDDLADGALIVGDIRPAGATGPARRNIKIPCGTAVASLRYEVEPGRYTVSATLPSGVVLMEDAEAREGEETTVALDASDSPYETHAWQYLMGNIEPGPAYHDDREGVPVPRSLGARGMGAVRAETDGGLIEESAAGTPPVEAVWVGDGKPTSRSFDSLLAPVSGAAGPAGAAPAGGLAKSLAEALAQSPPRTLPAPDVSPDGSSPLYRFGADGPVAAPDSPVGHHQFLVVTSAGLARLVTLPAPWGSAVIEVLVNTRQSPTGGAVAVTVRDPAVGAGLGYMAQGALDTAAALFTDVESLLYKSRNPLAAAAGAYVLVGTDLTNEPAYWDPWLKHLRERFGWMSDGSVLWATRQLRRATTDADVGRARNGLVEAFDRGVPFYTLGLSWLMDGLSEFPQDSECVRRLESARRLSWRVDMREPFVIVDIGGRRPG